MEDEKALKPRTLVRGLPDPVQYKIYDLLANSVVAPGVVVSGIFLARDQLFGVEELAVCTGPDLV